jgi:hypothetical protein
MQGHPASMFFPLNVMQVEEFRDREYRERDRDRDRG